MKSGASSPLAKVKARIRAAESKYRTVERVKVPLDADALEQLAELVERGDGKASEVLANAVAIGLRIMARSRAGAESAVDVEEAEVIRGMEVPTPNGIVHDPLVTAMLGVRGPNGLKPHLDNNEDDENYDPA